MRTGGGTRVSEIKNKRGLHARAAAKFAKLAGEFDAEVQVSRGGQTVVGTSIMGLMMLAAAIGTEIEMTATGNQSKEVLDALETLVADKFGED